MVNQDLIATYDREIAEAEKLQKLTQENVAGLQRGAAWKAGIAAPGILGLLSSATALQKVSNFNATMFDLLFISAVLLFLLCVGVAIVSYQLAGRAIARINLRVQIVSTLGTLARVAFRADRGFTPAEERTVDLSNAELAAIERGLKRQIPAVRRLGTGQTALLLAGYITILVLIASLRFP